MSLTVKKKYINGFPITPIGIGTWLVGGGVHQNTGQEFAIYDNDAKEIEILKYAILRGQNHIDTAWMYGGGHTEEIVGKAILGIDRKKLFIADKLWKTHMRRSSVIPAVIEMLRRLHTSYLDLLYVHTPNISEDMSDYIAGINDAIDIGFVRGIAVSNFSIGQLEKAVSLSKYPIFANQIHYNVLHKKFASNEMIDFCNKNNIMVVAYRPLEMGLIANDNLNFEIANLAKKYQKTSAQIALNWLVAQSNVVVVVKAESKVHVNENLEALNFEMEEEDFELLKLIPDKINH